MAVVAETPVVATFTPGIPPGVPNAVVPTTPVTTTSISSFQGP